MAERGADSKGGQAIPFIGVRMHRNRAAGGRRSSNTARRAALYVAFGRERQARQQVEASTPQRGAWYGPNGIQRSHEAVMDWVRRQALQNEYTFETILSVQQGELSAQDFNQALQQGGEIERWRLMVHDDTAYRHAHVLFFGERRMDKDTFVAWQQRVREELLRREQRQLQGEAWGQEAVGAESEAAREKGQGWEVGP